MDQTVVVSIDIQKGSEILAALDEAKLKVKVALWAVLSEYDDWRLIVSSPRLDEPGVDAYGLLNESLRTAGIDSSRKPPTLILPMTDPFVKQLRRIFGKTKSVEGMRLGGQLFGDRFIRDAYVYRIS